MIDKTMFSDRRGRRSLQGQQVACSQIIKDNQFNFFVQSNFPRKETTSLACAHNPPVVCADSPLYTKGPWLCIISTQQRKTKIVLWKCSILFGKHFGRKNVGNGVLDGPPLVVNPKQQRILHVEQTPTTKQTPLACSISHQ